MNLKPSNLLLDENGIALVSNFGLAEKIILNYEIDLVAPDHRDAYTTSTTLFSDGTNDRSKRNTNPDGLSTPQINESIAYAMLLWLLFLLLVNLWLLLSLCFLMLAIAILMYLASLIGKHDNCFLVLRKVNRGLWNHQPSSHM
ncbi:hypothetical protein SAY87_011856 [Trapa incisa]|uniref:Protein kinase domain-containing protein n=1 Tax=Trapa incisa TaxID=236973 RepID=A0AAN7GWZ7_9MYRT|nr:hypothetical protein SAY87_011856 [Trapa incisa]